MADDRRKGKFDRGDRNDRGPRKMATGFGRRRQCKFCSDKEIPLDYKHPEVLQYYITEKGKIVPRRISGTCAKHQRWLATEIKRSRQLALLPYTSGLFISDKRS